MTGAKEDSMLGLDCRITRRDFLNAGLLGAGGTLLYAAAPGVQAQAEYRVTGNLDASWYGYGGVGDYAPSHGNTPEVVNTAHQIRDGWYQNAGGQVPVTEEYDLVIVGGGMAGLGAAWHFKKHARPGQRCLLLDNHPLFGGEAKENEFDIGGTCLIAPQGANGFFMPPATDNPESVSGDARYYAELNIPRELPYQDWPESSAQLKFGQDNYGFTYWRTEEQVSVGHYSAPSGAAPGWHPNIWAERLASVPLSEQQRSNLLAWRQSRLAAALSQADEKSLDLMSYKEYLENRLGLSGDGAAYASDFLASAFGLGSDAISAYVAYLVQMPGLLTEEQYQTPVGERHSFPGGNSGFARYFLKNLLPAAIGGSNHFEDVITGHIRFDALDRADQPIRLRLNSTAVAVAHQGNPEQSESVAVTYSREGKLNAVRAKAVVMASGGWINRHVVKDMPEEISVAYQSFVHAPMLVANVALTNWRFLHRLGITACRWQGGFGSSCNIRRAMSVGRHQPPLDPDKPVVLTFYVNFAQPGMVPREQAIAGRMSLLGTAYADYERQIRRHMSELFGAAGFDAKRDIAGIILNRWGHAYVAPTPGFFFDRADRQAPRNSIMAGYGRIAFGHSELNGFQHWGPAADQGRRAVEQLLDVINS